MVIPGRNSVAVHTSTETAAIGQVLGQYREVTALTERSHDAGGHAWSLAATADLLRIRGELDDAAAQCPAALAEAALLSDPQFRIFATMNCGQVAMDRGELETARSLIEESARESEKAGVAVYAGNAQMVLAQMDQDASHWSQAGGRLEIAIKRFASIDERPGEATAQAMLALGAQANGDVMLRDRAMARAASLRAASTSREEVYLVDIALAQLADKGVEKSSAVERLRELAADAQRRHWLSLALEAKLAAWRLLHLQGDAPAATELAQEIEPAARNHGFRRIQALLAGTTPPR